MWLAIILLLAMHVAAGAPEDPPLGPVLRASCKVRWTVPTVHEDLTPLTDLDHLEIYFTTARGVYDWDRPALAVNPRRPHAPCPDWLMALGGQFYVTMRAFTSTGGRSAPSNEFAFVIDPKGTPDAPDDATVPPPPAGPWRFGW